MSSQWSLGLSTTPFAPCRGVPVALIGPIDQAVEPSGFDFFLEQHDARSGGAGFDGAGRQPGHGRSGCEVTSPAGSRCCASADRRGSRHTVHVVQSAISTHVVRMRGHGAAAITRSASACMRPSPSSSPALATAKSICSLTLCKGRVHLTWHGEGRLPQGQYVQALAASSHGADTASTSSAR